VLEVLRPIWTTKPETASRVRQRIEAVLGYATAAGARTGANPARWRGHLDHLLPKPGKVRAVEHHAALDWREAPAFVAALAKREGVAARAMAFTILTAARSGADLGPARAAVDHEAPEAEPTTPQAEVQAKRREALPSAVSVEQWLGLDPEERADLLGGHGETGPSFRKYGHGDPDVAMHGWDPLTGCLHTCPYCYARAIAEDKPRAQDYPHGFAPTLRPRALRAPRGRKPAKEAATDVRYRNVLACRLADLFEPHVPKEWTEAILREMGDAPDWKFILSRKSPERLAEFDLPTNA
jgi:hypothetical protein